MDIAVDPRGGHARSRHNMPAPDDKDRAVLLGYLEAAYPPRAPAGRGGWQNPFAK